MDMTAGRPTTYTQELADSICERLAQGESLRTVCKDDEMPCVASVFNWMRTHPEFLEQYTRAKQESADAMAEELLDISDNGVNDWMEKHYWEETVWVTNWEALQRSRLRVDTRKWLMSKMKPKKYGDKLELSGDNDAPLKIIIKLPWQKNETPEL